MIGAAKRKSISPPGLSALWTILVLVVALCLPETRVWGFSITPQHELSVFESVTPSSIREIYDGSPYDASDSLLAAKTPLARLQGTVDNLAEQHLLPQFRALDPNLKAGYTGSFSTGTVGNPTKATFGQPINLNKFDIDYWIKSDALFQKFVPNLKANPEFRIILSETPGFEGLKPNKEGFPIKFKPSGG
ncbi:hypothetical protein BH11VER1_BH11VER1_13610 [soil metagenome]